MKRLTKQEKLDRQGAEAVLRALNDFFSEINTASTETGYDIPDLYYSSLTSLHKELMSTAYPEEK